MGKKIKRSALNRIIKEETQRYILEKRVEQKLVQEGFLDRIKGFFSPQSAMLAVIDATGGRNDSPYYIDKDTETLMIKPHHAFEESFDGGEVKNLLQALTSLKDLARKIHRVKGIDAIPDKYLKDLRDASSFHAKFFDEFEGGSDAYFDMQNSDERVDNTVARMLRDARPPPQIKRLIDGYEAWRDGQWKAFQKNIELEKELQDKIKKKQAAYRREKEAGDRRQRDHEEEQARQDAEIDREIRARRRAEEPPEYGRGGKYSRGDRGGW